MSSQEGSNEVGEIVDRRLFDADGNIREDIAEERDEEVVEELSLELLATRIQTLESQTIQAMEQVDATFQQVGEGMNNLTEQIRSTISDMHVRIGVLEALLTDNELQADRDAMAAGKLTIDRYKEIAQDKVLPEMKIKAEAMQKRMQERFNRIQARIQAGDQPEDAVKFVNEEDEAAAARSKIEIVSG